jgi:DeoR family transcriptional regulator of aga operon
VRIGQVAARLVAAGDSILLDSRSTTLQVARHLIDDDSLIVVTNDVGILNELISHERTQVVFLGGALPQKPVFLWHAD